MFNHFHAALAWRDDRIVWRKRFTNLMTFVKSNLFKNTLNLFNNIFDEYNARKFTFYSIRRFVYFATIYKIHVLNQKKIALYRLFKLKTIIVLLRVLMQHCCFAAQYNCPVDLLTCDSYSEREGQNTKESNEIVSW